MTFNKITTIAMVTLFGISLCTTHKTNAQEGSDYGVIRISDNAQLARGSQGGVITTGNVVHNGEVQQYPSPFKVWEAPATHPVHPGFFYYKRAYPDYWPGQPRPAIRRTAPVIFTPTDTTQLGYYYQHVPVWQPNPNMIPPEPHPATWHNWNKLPTNVVWNRRGLGQPIGVVPPPGHPFIRGTQTETQGTIISDKKPNNKPPVPTLVVPEAK